MTLSGKALATACGVLALLLAGLARCDAQVMSDSGSSSRSVRAEAVETIPWEQLSPEARREAQRVLDSASIFRRMSATKISCDPDLYLFAVRYPEILVDIWRIMGVSTMTLQRNGPFTLKCNDGAGTVSEIELLYGTPHVHVFLGRGRYTGSRLVKQLEGSCLLVLHTRYHRSEDGRPGATSTLDVYVDIENSPAEWVARIVTPLFGSAADHNFVESLRFVEKLSETAARNGPGVVGMSRGLTGVHPEVRSRFAQIADLIHERELERELSETELVRPYGRQADQYLARPSRPAGNPR